MRYTRHAASLERGTSANLSRLSKLLGAASGGTWDRLSEDVVSYVAIEALNTWANFSRAYYVSCFLGLRLRSGSTVTTSPPFPGNTPNDAIGYAVNRWREKKNKRKTLPNGTWDSRDEPRWHDINKLLTLCADLNCSHIASVSRATSTTSRVFADLATFRNFFAHRNQFLEDEVMMRTASLGLPAKLRPAEALVYRPPSRPVGTLDQWLIDLNDVVVGLCA